MSRSPLKFLTPNLKTSSESIKSKLDYSELSSPNFKSFIKQTIQKPKNNVKNFDDSIISLNTDLSSSHYHSYLFNQQQNRLHQKPVLNNSLHKTPYSTLNSTMCEYENSKRRQSFLQFNRGIIQLSLVANENLLTLHIIQVKNIDVKRTLCCSNILVKITIIPDEKPLECNTRVVPNLNNNPTFNEKFSFELTGDDSKKRVCLSVYEYNENNSDIQLHGCLSFGIKNLIKKRKVHGWFYLLQDDVGIFRHRKVIEHIEKHISAINRDVMKMEEHQIIIPRGQENFGFTVVGQCPTFVGRVDNNSSAAVAGLRAGDYIVKINGKNVSRAQKDTVSHLIKNLRKAITLDIHRPSSSICTDSNRDLLSLLSSTGTASTSAESSTCSESSYLHSLSSYVCDQNRYQQQEHSEYSHKSKQVQKRAFVSLGQLGHYIEPKPLGKASSQTIIETNNASVLAQKGSPTITLV
ncbi:unnamed protein product [Didymodactylos carnosus]|uniref:Uncharacterized protein n=1 Tax=Didymodactylos carnosus TaxID=1234261 RepID=A0A814Z7X3_9BILA|nr:unnamed protein product [Didymodactylos carnosus]CAF1239308.1 unnamed protein product [Didymodactylos carnosus]CAF3975820.1 unnamed protein product [Didymodactylos carnosus]CAF4001474.1 unnamed protein product [Didymodactylos carnosus]